jgi:transcription termination factor Rho
VAAEALEQSMLESKDKEQLIAIAQALGIKTTARSAKATLIDKILETTRPAAPAAPPTGAPEAAAPAIAAPETDASASNGHAEPTLATYIAEQSADGAFAASSGEAKPARPIRGARNATPAAQGRRVDEQPEQEVLVGPDGEPLADWEIDLIRSGDVPAPTPTTMSRSAAAAQLGGEFDRPPADAGNSNSNSNGDGVATPGADGGRGDSASDVSIDDRTDGDGDNDLDDGDDEPQSDESRPGESRNARRRRRRRNKSGGGAEPQSDNRFEQRDRPQVRSSPSVTPGQTSVAEPGEVVESSSTEPVHVSGYLDLRDEGYGFLRVAGYLSSRDDAYIPVKLTRQYGLRKGDFVTGLSRLAGRNEKNPAMLEIHTVNGTEPEKARNRPHFEDLTALFPDERLKLENAADANNMTARIIDLVSPIGKGQRGIIVSPPKAGKTTVMKTIASSIEANHPEVKLIVLLIDERPEEVTDMRRTVKGEVISSTFDRPSDEHTHIAELAIEKAKRLVEQGEDVVIILDGITRLSRAYNLAAPASGRILSGGIDAGALYPPKKFFGAARNVEEGGSLTILATALVETNSRMDDAIFEEFKGTGNMELRLDRRLAERRIYPAIDVDASSTRHEELLFDRKQLQTVWKLRRVLSGLAADGNAAPGLELLIDRLKTFRTNDEFLNEIAKQPSM